MNLKPSILLLAGCVFYLESLKSENLQSLIFLIGSYIFIPAAIVCMCQKWFDYALQFQRSLESRQ